MNIKSNYNFIQGQNLIMSIETFNGALNVKLKS